MPTIVPVESIVVLLSSPLSLLTGCWLVGLLVAVVVVGVMVMVGRCFVVFDDEWKRKRELVSFIQLFCSSVQAILRMTNTNEDFHAVDGWTVCPTITTLLAA
jgi:hypothetical protein